MNSFSDFEGFSPHSLFSGFGFNRSKAGSTAAAGEGYRDPSFRRWLVSRGGFACLGLALMFHYEPSAYRVI